VARCKTNENLLKTTEINLNQPKNCIKFVKLNILSLLWVSVVCANRYTSTGFYLKQFIKTNKEKLVTGHQFTSHTA